MKTRGLSGCLFLLLALMLSSPYTGEARAHRKTAHHKVELYVTGWCPYCKKAKSYLDSRGIAYQLYDIEKDAGAARRKREISPNSGVPVAVIDGIVVKGWSQKAYEAVLDK